MVSFIADPRIKQSQNMRRTLLGQALTPYKLPANPYGGSPIGGNLQRLATAFAARQAGEEAASLKKTQRDAQNQIMAQILQLRTPPSGSTLSIQEAEDIQGIGDEARFIPARVSRRPYSMEMPPISAELLETAGLSPAGYELAALKSRTAGRTAYTARQEAEIDRTLGSITAAIALAGEGPERERLQNQRSQLLAIKDAAKTALRQETQEMDRAKEARQERRGLDVLVDAFNIELGRNVKVTKREMRQNPDNFVKAKSGENKLTKYEAHIKSLVRRGMSETDAADIAYGMVKVVVDPDTKQPFLVNIADRTTKPLALEMAKKPKPRPQKGKTGTLYGMVDEGPRVTGIVAGAEILGEEVFGQVPVFSGEIASKDQIRNETAINAAKNNLIRALSINPRFPVGEMQRLAKEIDVAPSIWVSTGALLEKMKGVDDYLRGRLQNELAASRDMALPSTTRKNARTAAKDIKNFLDKLGVPQPGSETSDDLSKMTNDELLESLGYAHRGIN